MIAIPVKTNKEEGILAPLFGKAKYFALVDQAGTCTLQESMHDNGIKVAKWLHDLGVKSIILSHIGEKPFHACLENHIDVYFAGNERITLKDVLEKFHAHTLDKVTVVNYMALLGEHEHSHEGESHHTCSCSEIHV